MLAISFDLVASYLHISCTSLRLRRSGGCSAIGCVSSSVCLCCLHFSLPVLKPIVLILLQCRPTVTTWIRFQSFHLFSFASFLVGPNLVMVLNILFSKICRRLWYFIVIDYVLYPYNPTSLIIFIYIDCQFCPISCTSQFLV